MAGARGQRAERRGGRRPLRAVQVEQAAHPEVAARVLALLDVEAVEQLHLGAGDEGRHPVGGAEHRARPQRHRLAQADHAHRRRQRRAGGAVDQPRMRGVPRGLQRIGQRLQDGQRVALGREQQVIRHQRIRFRIQRRRPTHDACLRLSACIITFNEADRIGDCIASLAFCDEVVVVDSHSTDATAAIAQQLGARVLQRPFDGFRSQKQFAVEQATHDWVLCLDADERVSDALARRDRGGARTRFRRRGGLPLRAAVASTSASSCATATPIPTACCACSTAAAAAGAARARSTKRPASTARCARCAAT